MPAVESVAPALLREGRPRYTRSRAHRGQRLDVYNAFAHATCLRRGPRCAGRPTCMTVGVLGRAARRCQHCVAADGAVLLRDSRGPRVSTQRSCCWQRGGARQCRYQQATHAPREASRRAMCGRGSGQGRHSGHLQSEPTQAAIGQLCRSVERTGRRIAAPATWRRYMRHAREQIIGMCCYARGVVRRGAMWPRRRRGSRVRKLALGGSHRTAAIRPRRQREQQHGRRARCQCVQRPCRSPSR